MYKFHKSHCPQSWAEIVLIQFSISLLNSAIRSATSYILNAIFIQDLTFWFWFQMEFHLFPANTHSTIFITITLKLTFIQFQIFTNYIQWYDKWERWVLTVAQTARMPVWFLRCRNMTFLFVYGCKKWMWWDRSSQKLEYQFNDLNTWMARAAKSITKCFPLRKYCSNSMLMVGTWKHTIGYHSFLSNLFLFNFYFSIGTCYV